MHRAFWIPLVLGLTAYVLLPLPGSPAPLPERIAKQRTKVQSKKRKEGVLSETIRSQGLRLEALRGEVGELQGRQARLQEQLDRRRAEILAVRGRRERALDRLARLRERLAVGRRALEERLVELYKADDPDILTVVLNADGFADLLERTEFLGRVADQDRRIVARVRELKGATTRAARRLAVLERRAEDAASAVLARRNEIAAVKARMVSARRRLEDARNKRRRTLAGLRRSRARAQEDLRALEAEQARVRAALRRAAARDARSAPAAAPVRRGSGRLIWPVSGPITSPFGPRWGRLHAGLDIGAAEGTPIRAADSGRVVIAGAVGAYGNYTCVQHSVSISTCYAHQSRLGTSEGADVRQGQVMGYVGNTGRSFGAHLHFEVRVGGSPVDPLGYL